MNKYLATVRVKGNTVRTMVFADNFLHARLILEYQFGIGCLVGALIKTNEIPKNHIPLDEFISRIKTIKPLDPQQARIESLKKQKDIAIKNLKAERNRQKIAKAQMQISQANAKNPIKFP